MRRFFSPSQRRGQKNCNAGVLIIESVRPWTDESLQNRVQEKEGDFAVLRDTAAEIIYIVRSSFNDLAASRPDIH